MKDLGADPNKGSQVGWGRSARRGTHISEGQEHGIKVQEYSKEDEEDAEASGAHTNLCNG